ncbi:MAG: polysaccharide biosynthesis/export family protein, partial [Planctomycetales bacterium]|nr:polysaccharide biosynthesis/export family protein [Planctomycetales bacterium]
ARGSGQAWTTVYGRGKQLDGQRLFLSNTTSPREEVMHNSALHRLLLSIAILSTFGDHCWAQAAADAPPVQKSDTAGPQTPIAPQTPTFGMEAGNVNHCNYSLHNLPPQPQVAAGRCLSCTVGVDCADNCGGHRQDWRDLHRYNFQPLAHGEYLGPIRLPATTDYRVRVGDQLRFIYILSRQVLADSFPLQVGDELQINSLTDESIRLGDVVQGRGVQVQSDGMLYLRLIGPVRAAGLTIPQLRRNLEEAYKDKIINPAIDIIPIKTNTLLEEIRSAVVARVGLTGQSFTDAVHPDGTLRLPKLGPICVQGMTLNEIKREVNLRYQEIVAGLEVEPVLDVEAQHFVFVYGQVGQPGRFQLQGPTSVTQALAMAGGAVVGGNTREIVIFRRAEDWRLIATRVDLRGAHLGKVPTPADEIWLRDNDLIIVPPTPIRRFDNFVSQVFTQGVYGIFPFAQVGSGIDIGANNR